MCVTAIVCYYAIMSETPGYNPIIPPVHEEQPRAADFSEAVLPPEWETEAGRQAAFDGYLERRGIDPAATPRLTMNRREFDLFRNAPPAYTSYARQVYGIPQEDQANAPYAFVSVTPENPDQQFNSGLVITSDDDFGTQIDLEIVSWDFQPSEPHPDDPDAPESATGALISVDISETLNSMPAELHDFAVKLMEGKTVDPLSTHYGDIGIRAGSLHAGQKDAFVWNVSPFTRSLELTIAFPTQYDSVTIVRGHRRPASNGKPTMAQIDNPEEVLRIEGEQLQALQDIYRKLYRKPDFALSAEQRSNRDQLFNTYLSTMLSRRASRNRAAEQEKQQEETAQQQPKARQEQRRSQPLKVRQLPRP